MPWVLLPVPVEDRAAPAKAPTNGASALAHSNFRRVMRLLFVMSPPGNLQFCDIKYHLHGILHEGSRQAGLPLKRRRIFDDLDYTAWFDIRSLEDRGKKTVRKLGKPVMKRIGKSLLVLCVVLGQSATAATENLPSVMILATGGTIAGAASEPGTEYQSGIFSIQQLVGAVPEIAGLANISAEQIANIGSQHMTNAVWLKLARRIHKIRESNEYDAIVITHGTDTLEETAFFLDLLFPGGPAIVLTGAARPADALSADGPRNLLEAVALATSEHARNRGVMVTMNGRIHAARSVTKVHTENSDALVSVNGGEVGEFVVGKPVFFAAADRAGFSDFDLSRYHSLPKVGVIASHANVDAGVVQYYSSAGFQGIVISGLGNGNMGQPLIDALSAAVTDPGLVVVRSTRVQNGYVSRNVEIDDDAQGFVAGLSLSPQKARILLQLALLLSKEINDLQSAFGCDAPLATNLCEDAH